MKAPIPRYSKRFVRASHLAHTLTLVFWTILSAYLVYVGHVLSSLPDMLSRDLKPSPLATPLTFCAVSAFLFSLYRLGRAIQRLRRDATLPAHPDRHA